MIRVGRKKRFPNPSCATDFERTNRQGKGTSFIRGSAYGDTVFRLVLTRLATGQHLY